MKTIPFLTITHFSICHPDYLQDHRGVIGVMLAGQTREEMAQAVVDELNSCDYGYIPEGITDDTVREAAAADIADGARFWPVDESGTEIETTDMDDPQLQAEQPYAWFRVELWTDDSCTERVEISDED